VTTLLAHNNFGLRSKSSEVTAS